MPGGHLPSWGGGAENQAVHFLLRESCFKEPKVIQGGEGLVLPFPQLFMRTGEGLEGQ